MTEAKILRCAVYTRKSTEEGLEQAFNSLHAQRGACEAYIKSQAHEGWRLVKTAFDDGGYSGGNLERPALKALLEQVGQRRIDIIVVYKVDRLTRSLTDFSKIVETLDVNGCSFVSVTQSFNTTNSMGRLTLNVLLSFAQFEREVTGERIRDKFAASKRKGIWMGGVPPLGFDVKDRKLVINLTEAEHVRYIFRRYIQLRGAPALVEELRDKGITSKHWTTRSGRKVGGCPIHRGGLYWMLKNHTFVGEISHRGQIYKGEHQAIIDRATWDEVQELLKGNRRRPRIPGGSSGALLQGLLFDDRGNPMSPTHTRKKTGVRYSYYISQAMLQGRKQEAGSLHRVSAPQIERLVEDTVVRRFPNGPLNVSDLDPLERAKQLRSRISRIVVSTTAVAVTLAEDKDGDASGAPQTIEHKLPAGWKKPFKSREGSVPTLGEVRSSQAVARMFAKAWHWRRMLETGEATSIWDLARKVDCHHRYADDLVSQSFRSPTEASAMLNGTSTTKLGFILNEVLQFRWSSQ